MKNYYEILQVKNFAEIEVVKASYKALCKKYHPDINKDVDPKVIVDINNAYDILGNSVEKNKYDELLKEFLSKNDNAKKDSTENNIKDYEFNDLRRNDESKSKFLVLRIPLSILISLCIGMIGSYLILGIISINSSWLYIIYTFFGALIGTIIAKVSGVQNSIMGFIGAIITIICMVFPFYEYLYDTLPLIYGELYSVEFFLKATKEIIHLLLGSGFIRMIFVLMTPICAYEILTD